MRICGDGTAEALARGRTALLTAYEAGYTHFDHANIYGHGECETLHGKLLKELPELRARAILTTKCGIRRKDSPGPGDPSRYDFSKAHIIAEAEGSLKRLGVECLDVLLLHRLDYLGDPHEVASAFCALKDSGKVSHFGVSNFRPSSISMLQSICPMPLIMHQVEVNIHRIDALEDGTLDQCMERHITPSAWCPLGGVAYAAWGNSFTPEQETRIAEELNRQAEHYNKKPWQVILAWLLIHPARIAPIVGTTNPERVKAAVESLDIPYSREDFYRLLEARNGRAVP